MKPRDQYLKVEDVSKTFTSRQTMGGKLARAITRKGPPPGLQAVSGVTLELAKGQTLGLVGESGCGKSTLGRIMAGIHSPSAGTVRIDGLPVMEHGKKTTTAVQTVFQDPFASLDPRMKVGDAVAEGPILHGLIMPSMAQKYVERWFARVGLDPSLSHRYPHQFSGGQRQRIAIARALAMQPKLLICDEPVASLDVSIQAQVINLFLELRRELELTCVFISHDLSVVRHVSDRVAVMYLGRIVELGETQSVFGRPAHPYTAALLDSVPRIAAEGEALVEFKPIEGEIPSPLNPPPGCHFAPRCPR
ncbi:ABC transporter ATP-binding protein [Mangrovicoccus ximenensis]|uniref:ABC transporter ATP-binding protein n=1 Tax=Mangrovicoccus ximenensis TaxID=1911570 RepID=UPI000D33D481|nr:oligopeptide/dipeptide ABC transporter ATP-binding protein [Mangrovicoccus ximenensis]